MPHFTVGNYGIFIFLNQEIINLMLSIICSVTLSIESRFLFVSVSGFSVHAARQICGELSQDTCFCVPMLVVFSIRCQIRLSTSVLIMARCAGW